MRQIATVNIGEEEEAKEDEYVPLAVHNGQARQTALPGAPIKENRGK